MRPPKGMLDEGGKWYKGKTPTLLPLVETLRPQVLICGHMHFDGGKVLRTGGTTAINAALHNVLLDFDGGEAIVTRLGEAEESRVNPISPSLLPEQSRGNIKP